MSINKLILDVERKAERNGISIKLIDKKAIVYPGEKIKTNGYFCSSKMLLAVAVGKPQKEWLPIFIHESCHMDQVIFDPYQWEKWNVGYTLFFEWLDGKELPIRILKKCWRDIVECELDCEMRTLQKIKKYQLPINPDWYVKASNVYLYSYNYLMKVRKWKTGLYEDKSLLENAPNEFKKPHQYGKIPMQLRKSFKIFYES